MFYLKYKCKTTQGSGEETVPWILSLEPGERVKLEP